MTTIRSIPIRTTSYADPPAEWAQMEVNRRYLEPIDNAAAAGLPRLAPGIDTLTPMKQQQTRLLFQNTTRFRMEISRGNGTDVAVPPGYQVWLDARVDENFIMDLRDGRDVWSLYYAAQAAPSVADLSSLRIENGYPAVPKTFQTGGGLRADTFTPAPAADSLGHRGIDSVRNGFGAGQSGSLVSGNGWSYAASGNGSP